MDEDEGALKRQYQRPEGKLIEDALLRRNLKSTEAAPLGGLKSAQRFRDIVNGYNFRDSEARPVRATSGRLARIANSLGITASQLRDADRGDAADVLAILASDVRPANDAASIGGLHVLTAEQRDGLLSALRNIRESADEAVQFLGG